MKELTIRDLNMNPVTRIAEEWMLLTAGTQGNYNTMTCSWGHLGELWGRPTAVCYVRPQRYTKEFIDREPYFTICFFDGRKKELAYLGSHSGRDGDKVAAVGLTPVFENGYTYFAEASLVLVCRKLYRAPLREENFVDHSVFEEVYPQNGLHDLYIGQIERILGAESDE